MIELAAPGAAEVEAARGRIRGFAVRTPLLRLAARPGEPELWLKLEALQPIGSFKIRGAATVLGATPRELLKRGVYTASAGNMAQGIAWCAREMGIAATAVVPDSAPRAKLEAIAALGASIVPRPFAEWWQVLVDRGTPALQGHFIHPVSDPAVLAGNATIGLEIAEDLPEVSNVYVPYGGGGLSTGIAAGLRAAGSRARVFAAEVETAAPLRASLGAGHPVAIEHRPSFVDGIGGRSLLPEMWPLASTLLAGSCVVTLEEIRSAIRVLIARARVVAEGAGGTALAAALAGRAAQGLAGANVAPGPGPTVCVISGGNIDPEVLASILRGEPGAAVVR